MIMTQQSLSPEDESWLRDYLKTLPDAFNFDFEQSTRNLIRDQGIGWVRDHEDLLRSEAEYLASLLRTVASDLGGILRGVIGVRLINTSLPSTSDKQRTTSENKVVTSETPWNHRDPTNRPRVIGTASPFHSSVQVITMRAVSFRLHFRR